MNHLTYLQSVVTGALQGVTELFPVSSLGHSVLVPAWVGGSWATLAIRGRTAQPRPQRLAWVAAVAAHLSVRFLTRFFSGGTPTPSAVCCLAAGLLSVARFA